MSDSDLAAAEQSLSEKTKLLSHCIQDITNLSSRFEAVKAENARLAAELSLHREVVRRITEVEAALEGGKELMSCQGQPMDGYSALANFRDIAQKAKSLLPEGE